MGLQDGQVYQLAQYLIKVPNLRSLILNSNSLISDDGIGRLAAALSKNDKLAHLSLMNCQGLSNESL
jgi:Ran GTPase-activating protein (RanGAP) involved in mRNA processing and transport